MFLFKIVYILMECMREAFFTAHALRFFNVDELVKNGSISMDSIVDADIYIKQKLSYIIHGDLSHYQYLKRVRNKNIAKEAHLKTLLISKYLIII